jgi:hypothetical protein
MKDAEPNQSTSRSGEIRLIDQQQHEQRFGEHQYQIIIKTSFDSQEPALYSFQELEKTHHRQRRVEREQHTVCRWKRANG